MRDIYDAIDQYAKAYGVLEYFQRTRSADIPIGDQKTGVIAEFFARVYAKSRFPAAKLEFGSASEHAWDIKVVQPHQTDLKIQVKSVSAYSQTSRISPIHAGWHQLWLMRLDEHLRPHALWVIEAQNVPWSQAVVKSKTMPKLGKAKSGSAEFWDAANETTTFLAALKRANPSRKKIRTKRHIDL